MEPETGATAGISSEPLKMSVSSVEERSATASIAPFSEQASKASSPQGSDIEAEAPTQQRIADPRTVQEEEPTRTKWNHFALAAPILLIVALAIAIPAQSTELLLIGCALAFTAALIGARQCRDRGERGQGFAMAVIGFALAGVLIATIALLSRL